MTYVKGKETSSFGAASINWLVMGLVRGRLSFKSLPVKGERLFPKFNLSMCNVTWRSRAAFVL